jgi:hypothetical protein
MMKSLLLLLTIAGLPASTTAWIATTTSSPTLSRRWAALGDDYLGQLKSNDPNASSPNGAANDGGNREVGGTLWLVLNFRT